MSDDFFKILFGNESDADKTPEAEVPFVDVGKGRAGDPEVEHAQDSDGADGDIQSAPEIPTKRAKPEGYRTNAEIIRSLSADDAERIMRDLQANAHDNGSDGRSPDGGLPNVSPVLHHSDIGGQVLNVEVADEGGAGGTNQAAPPKLQYMEADESGCLPRPTDDTRGLIESALSESPWVKRLDSTMEWEFPWAPGNTEEQRIEATAQIESVIPRMGAKSKLREWLVNRFPPHHTYVEPFGGSFKVLLWKRNNSKIEIINDVDDDLIHFFRYVTFWPDQLADLIDTVPTSQKLMKAFKSQLAEGELTGLERAAAFYVVARLSFNGTGTSYSGSVQSLARCSSDKQAFRRIARRLKRVDIRSTDCFKLIKTCNKDLDHSTYPGGLFFYLDPPYDDTHGYETAKEKSTFGWGEQYKLYQQCCEIDKNNNKFIQTNAATERLYKLYGREFNIVKRDVVYTVSGSADARGKNEELIISNFDLTEESKRPIGGLFG